MQDWLDNIAAAKGVTRREARSLSMHDDLVYLSWSVEGTSIILDLPGGGQRRMPAQPFLETMIKAQENLNATRDLGPALGALGNVLMEEENWFEAISVLKRAEAAFIEAGDLEGASRVQCNLGLAHEEVSDPVEARSCLEKCITHARDVGAPGLEADGLWNLALVYGRGGDVAKACVLGEEAVAILERLGDRFACEARAHLESWKL